MVSHIFACARTDAATQLHTGTAVARDVCTSPPTPLTVVRASLRESGPLDRRICGKHKAKSAVGGRPRLCETIKAFGVCV